MATSAPAAAATVAPHRGTPPLSARPTTTRKRFARLLYPYGLLTPLLLWWGIIIAYPLVRAVIISLTNASPLTPTTSFVGLSNFREVFAGGATTASVEFTAEFAIASTAIELVGGATLALLLSRLRRFRWLRGVVMIPWAISEIVTATAGTWLFNARFGMVNAIFHALRCGRYGSVA